MEQEPTGKAPVTVVVVSFNTRRLLVQCLRSLAEDVADARADVWVVDNGSNDGSAQAAREHAPWASVVEPGSNLGYGPAVNLVARRTHSEWLACANADTALGHGALRLLLAAGADPNVGCIAPQLVLPDGTAESSLHSFPTIPFTLALNLGLHRLSARLADRMLIPGRYELGRRREPPWAIGAFLLLRRSAFEEVGGFDDRQWLFAEDLDLGWRLRQAGWITRYEPGAVVRHESGAVTSAAFGSDRTPRFMRATYLVVLRRRGLAQTWITAALNVLGAAARVTWMRPLAALSRRWRGPLAQNRMWLNAHRQGLRSRSELERGDQGGP